MDSIVTLLGILQYFANGVRRVLVDDIEAVTGGLVINVAKQKLRELEDRINYVSVHLAADVSPQPLIEDWIREARKTSFCLADQIAMYAVKRIPEIQLALMRLHIGTLSIQQLMKNIKRHDDEMPDAVRRSESTLDLSKIYPFIGHPRSLSPGAMVGMDSEIKKVEEFLARTTSSVLFITGRQGSGKTRLMEAVRGKDSAGPCCWVDVENIGDLDGLLKKVLEGSKVKDCDSIHELDQMKMIHDTFKDKHYFIVLDNVQDTRVLYSLKQVLKGYNTKIICLTRREDIKYDENQEMLHITGLEQCDSIKLLLDAAFPQFNGTQLQRENFNATYLHRKTFNQANRDRVLRAAIEHKYNLPQIENTSLADKMVVSLNAILSKCQNNPSNIWTVGTYLEDKPLEKWDGIEEKIDGMMLIDGTETHKKLDPPIKQEDAELRKASSRDCFLYCLAFPEESEDLENPGIPIRKLIRLWAAEGFVQDSPSRSQEEEAECLLQELIKKNLLVVKKKGFDGEVLKCSVNEHIRPLAEKMCEKQNLCRIVNDDSDEAPLPSSSTKCFPTSPNIRIFRKKTLSDRYRMLAVHGDRGVDEASKALGEDIRLRSLLHFKTRRVHHSELRLSFSHIFRLLRTLELQGTRLAQLPPSINCLACLRYLGLRDTQLEDLPPTLSSLSHLMCLDIRDTNIAEVTDVSHFTEMRHLYLANSFRSHSVLIREGLQSLIHLQTLSGAAYREPSVPQHSSDVLHPKEEISELRCLRKLSMKKALSTRSESICCAINKLDSLQSLAISCDRGGQQFDVSFLKVGKNLRKLKLGGPIQNFCDLKSKMRSITYLYLWDSKLSVDPLLTLQNLENLLLLSLFNAYTKDKMTFADVEGYGKLKKLSIISIENLTECKFVPEAMKNLEMLVFSKCHELKNPPPGLDKIPCLKEVHLAQMPGEFCREAQFIINDKVFILEDAHSHVSFENPFHTSSGAAT